MHVGVNLLFLAPSEMGGLEVYSRELVRALAQRDDVRLTLFVNRLAGPEWAELAPTAFAAKLAIIRPAVQQFLTDPSAVLCGFPQAGMAHKRATA